MFRRFSRGQLLAAAAIGLLGPTIAVAVATAWGIGVSPDSISYLAGAGRIAAGDGFSLPGNPPTPITHFPPFYPSILAFIGLAGVDPMTAARWFAGFTFAANILLVGWLLARVNDVRPLPGWASVLGMLLMLLSTAMLEIHTMAWTEPTFILLGLTGFVLLARWLEEGGVALLMLSALVIGLSSVTRYAGAAYWGAGVLGVVLLSRDSWLARLKYAFVFALIGVVPIGAWVARNLAVADTATNRTLYLHVPSLTLVWEGVATVSSWFLLPGSLSTMARALLVLLLVAAMLGLYLVTWRASSGHAKASPVGALPAIVWLFVLFVPVYGGVLLLSNSVVRAYTPMESRILSPLYPVLLVLLLHGCHRFQEHAPARLYLRPVFVGLALFVVGLASLKAGAFVRQGERNGLGFNGIMWHQSKTLAALRALGSSGKVFSNAPEAVYVHVGRLAEKLPQPVESATRLDNPRYANEARAMQREIDEHGGLIVLFDLPWRNSRGDEQRIQSLGVQPIVKTDDGVIYAEAPGAGALR